MATLVSLPGPDCLRLGQAYVGGCPCQVLVVLSPAAHLGSGEGTQQSPGCFLPPPPLALGANARLDAQGSGLLEPCLWPHLLGVSRGESPPLVYARFLTSWVFLTAQLLPALWGPGKSNHGFLPSPLCPVPGSPGPCLQF